MAIRLHLPTQPNILAHRGPRATTVLFGFYFRGMSMTLVWALEPIQEGYAGQQDALKEIQLKIDFRQDYFLFFRKLHPFFLLP